MSGQVHVAVTRRIRAECIPEFERELNAFASRSLADPRSRGVQLLYPAPGSGSREYGILRSFAGPADRDAFYASAFYREWIASVEHMQEAAPVFREVEGLEAWFREPHHAMPPRWRMALLTWAAVWPVSMLVPLLMGPLLPKSLPLFVRAGFISAGIVLVLTWAAMPLLVRAAQPWLHPKPSSPPRP
ncbi:MAG: hypothetical protein JWM59_4058 [Verrucomicrobiales bacterium]|nr:hypothetical protein [Verrucomicrobiales bacterium]